MGTYGVERTTERKLFLVEVPDRTAQTLLGLITTYVLPGSIIHTDCFASYTNLNQLFEHYTVNHSENFRDPVTGSCTNTIEGTWNGVKMNIRPRNRISGAIEDHFAEFIWRRIHETDPCNGLISTFMSVQFSGYNLN
jgi:hypothetical protein